MSTKVLNSSKFTVYLKGEEVIVECKSTEEVIVSLNSANMETDAIQPHGDKDCDCLNVLHKTFRLKIIHIKREAVGYGEFDLYITDIPSNDFNARCVVTRDFVLEKYPVQSFYQTPLSFPGWKYLTTIPSLVGMFRLSISYFKAKPFKYEISTFLAPRPSICDNLFRILEDGKYSDVTVSSQDGATIKAHRCILAKRSEVFRAALEHNETTDQITSHFNEETLRQIMTYIYTDRPPELHDFTADLFLAADYYQLSDLKEVCVAALYSRLKIENAIATLELAEQHSLKDLLTFTLDFINKNFDLIKKTKDWDNIQSIVLLKMISECNIAQKSDSHAAGAVSS